MKKILFITTQFPYPLNNGGKIGAFNGLDALSDHDVHLLAFSEEMNCIEEGKVFLKKRWKNITIENVIEHEVHIKHSIFKLILAVLRSYLSKS